MAVTSQFQADPEASSGIAVSLHETSSQINPEASSGTCTLPVSLYETSNQSQSQTNPETISSDTPPVVSVCETFGASGLISPDLADILATPAENAAVVKKRVKRIV